MKDSSIYDQTTLMKDSSIYDQSTLMKDTSIYDQSTLMKGTIFILKIACGAIFVLLLTWALCVKIFYSVAN